VPRGWTPVCFLLNLQRRAMIIQKAPLLKPNSDKKFLKDILSRRHPPSLDPALPVISPLPAAAAFDTTDFEGGRLSHLRHRVSRCSRRP